MYNAVFFVAILGALLGAAKCDFKCFVDKMTPFESLVYKFFGDDKDPVCHAGKKDTLNFLQQAIDECAVPVTTDSMSSLLDEMCDTSTELSQDLKGNSQCLAFNSLQNHIVNMNCKPERNSSLSAKETCLKLRRDFFTCTANNIGERCGERAGRALKRIYQTTDSLTNGMRDELAAKSSKSSYLYIVWIVIGVGVFISFIGIFIKMNKKRIPNENTTAAV